MTLRGPLAAGPAPVPSLQVVILAAGLGSRLGGGMPKALTRLSDGTTILEHQLSALTAVVPQAQVTVVVGHMADAVRDAHPGLGYVVNDAYASTNTGVSLLRALEACAPGPVLWLNGDVVFDPAVLTRVVPLVEQGRSGVVVDTANVGEEEVKYDLDGDGLVRHLSKTVAAPLGEAVGINLVAAADRPALERRLREVAGSDYFERGIELAVERDGARFHVVDVSDLFAVEIDFPEDLARANEHLGAEPADGPRTAATPAV